MIDDDDDLPVSFSPEVATEMERIGADEEAFERLAALFEWVHGRPSSTAAKAFQWGAKNTDENLIALGFESRAGFQSFYDLVLMVEQGPRAKDTLN